MIHVIGGKKTVRSIVRLGVIVLGELAGVAVTVNASPCGARDERQGVWPHSNHVPILLMKGFGDLRNLASKTRKNPRYDRDGSTFGSRVFGQGMEVKPVDTLYEKEDGGLGMVSNKSGSRFHL